MKRIILIICLAAAGIVNAKAQTRVVISRPVGRAAVASARTVIVSPVRSVVVRPALTLVRPVARRRVVVVHR
jgi:hypothetical protein